MSRFEHKDVLVNQVIGWLSRGAITTTGIDYVKLPNSSRASGRTVLSATPHLTNKTVMLCWGAGQIEVRGISLILERFELPGDRMTRWSIVISDINCVEPINEDRKKEIIGMLQQAITRFMPISVCPDCGKRRYSNVKCGVCHSSEPLVMAG